MGGRVGERGVELRVEQRVSGPVPRLRGDAREQLATQRVQGRAVPVPRLYLAHMRRRGVSSACAGSHWVCSCGEGFPGMLSPPTGIKAFLVGVSGP